MTDGVDADAPGTDHQGVTADSGRGRTVSVDAHVHTAASFDATTTPEQLLAAASDTDLDALVVTDHDTMEGARVASSLATEADPLVIEGCEVSTADGHLLAIGIDRTPQPGLPLADTVRSVRDQGGVAVVPHPFQRSRHGVAAGAIDDVDGLEVANAQTLTGVRNTQAERFATRESHAAFGGSDSHSPASVGAAATAVDLPPGDPLSEASVLDAMRAGHTSAVTGRVSALCYLDRIVTNATLKTYSVF